MQSSVSRMRLNDVDSYKDESEEEDHEVLRPSAKALGKRRQANLDESECQCSPSSVVGLDSTADDSAAFDPDDLFYEHTNESRPSDNLSDDDSDDNQRPWHHQPVHYVYDAAAERMKERLKEAHLSSPVVSGVVH